MEDDPQLGPVMRQVLDEVYAVTLVSDGEAGVAAALDSEFEVMIVDRRLPSLDGLGVIETLRRKRITTPDARAHCARHDPGQGSRFGRGSE